ncbi:hypothetical protein FB563_3124 [Streptomyces puniciscabiei]|uniref:Uncharacterized protein n=1 Tax=Streptomyces puniciscabiei TaxID=164348 RepID=A0A542UGA9_9ACTN|nr:hypothetical protein [Streptomyces puniciscabiei]TQK98110.1 hypothetical protein FB563_3124 [Streptomyces puniciscabiei]
MESPERPGRRRTAALIAGAAVLGVVAGVCTGYVVQAGRPPTKLPSLSQPVVAQAKGPVEPLSAAYDRRVKTDGDLRKLLLRRPAGARADDFGSSDGWMDLAGYASTFEQPNGAFRYQLGTEFRRAARTAWRIGTYDVEIRLIQYRQVLEPGAAKQVESQRKWAEQVPDTGSSPIPGTGDGMVYVHRTPETKSGYLPVYLAEAIASRGDVFMDIWISDTRPIPENKIMDLAKRQVAQL